MGDTSFATRSTVGQDSIGTTEDGFASGDRIRFASGTLAPTGAGDDEPLGLAPRTRASSASELAFVPEEDLSGGGAALTTPKRDGDARAAALVQLRQLVERLGEGVVPSDEVSRIVAGARGAVATAGSPGLISYAEAVRLLGYARLYVQERDDGRFRRAWTQYQEHVPGAQAVLSPGDFRTLKGAAAQIRSDYDEWQKVVFVDTGTQQEIYEGNTTMQRRDRQERADHVKEQKFLAQAEELLEVYRTVRRYHEAIQGAQHSGGGTATAISLILDGGRALERAMKLPTEGNARYQAMGKAMGRILTGIRDINPGSRPIDEVLDEKRLAFYGTIEKISGVLKLAGPWGLALGTAMSVHTRIERLRAGDITNDQFWVGMLFDSLQVAFKGKIEGAGSLVSQAFRSALISNANKFAVKAIGIQQSNDAPEVKQAKLSAAWKEAVLDTVVDTATGLGGKAIKGAIGGQELREIVDKLQELAVLYGVEIQTINGKTIEDWIEDVSNKPKARIPGR